MRIFLASLCPFQFQIQAIHEAIKAIPTMRIFIISLTLLLLGAASVGGPLREISEGINFRFKGNLVSLTRRIGVFSGDFMARSAVTRAQMDTLCNVFYPAENRVDIIRQDDPLRPRIGLALSFEFDEENGEYPYSPAFAAVQLKDFGYGGVEFDPRDTCNYTGVSNEVSDDLTIEIDGFQNDTIFGRFNALLLSGSGGMAAIENGAFKIRVFRR